MAPTDRTVSDAQRTALESMRDPAHGLVVARAEFVNTALRADGVHVEDLGPVDANTAARVASLLDAAGMDPAKLAAATEAARVLAEFREHRDAGRFLFLLDADGLPFVYFQCATPGNPDVFDAATGAPLYPPAPVEG